MSWDFKANMGRVCISEFKLLPILRQKPFEFKHIIIREKRKMS